MDKWNGVCKRRLPQLLLQIVLDGLDVMPCRLLDLPDLFGLCRIKVCHETAQNADLVG